MRVAARLQYGVTWINTHFVTGQRDAARRLQALRLRQGPFRLRARGLHGAAPRDGEALERPCARQALLAPRWALLCGRRARAPAAARWRRLEEQELHIYNWADYIGQDTIAEFEAATGIKVIYDTYDSDETLEAKIMAGRLGLRRGQHLDRLLQPPDQGRHLSPLDRAQLPNWKNLDPHALAVEARPTPATATPCPTCSTSMASPTTST